MKNRIKNWLIVLLIGAVGIALVTVFMLGTGQFMSYEATETYALEGEYQKLAIDAARAQVTVLPDVGEPRVTIYAKAWLPGPIDLSKRFTAEVKGETLTLKVIPFEPTFLGFFPQPYEMTITAYVPMDVYESYGRDGA